MRTILYISLLFLIASCTHLDTPPLPGPTKASVGYAWPDSDATYTYKSDSDTHVIHVSKGGAITDLDSATGKVASWSVTEPNGAYQLNNLAPHDIFSMGDGITVAVPSAPLPVHSIAAMGKDVYAVSDTALYVFDASTNGLKWVDHAPANNLRLFEAPNRLYAAEIGGYNVWYRDPNATGWTPVCNSSTFGTITTMVAGREHGDDAVWIASGRSLTDYRKGSFDKPILFPDSIRAFSAHDLSGNEGVLAGCKNGRIYEVHDDTNFVTIVKADIRAIDNNAIASDKGLDVLLFGHDPNIGPLRTLYGFRQPGYNVLLLGADNGEIIEYNGIGSLGKPSPNIPVSAITVGGAGPQDYFALVGASMWHYAGGTNWTVINLPLGQNLGVARGAFTLLSTDTSWDAPFTEKYGSGSVTAQYHASVLGPAATVQLEDVSYPNVLIVTYTPVLVGGVTATAGITLLSTSLPSYTIYFERGVGPIRIERGGTGTSTIYRLTR